LIPFGKSGRATRSNANTCPRTFGLMDHQST
jgi:hypothetical protein